MSLNGHHQVAVWAGAAAFLGSLLTIGLIDVLDPDRIVQYLSALVVALVTGGTVYARERLNDAKRKEGYTTLQRKDP